MLFIELRKTNYLGIFFVSHSRGIKTKSNSKTNTMKKVMLTVAAAVLMSALSFAQDAAKPAQEKKEAPKKDEKKADAKDAKKAEKKDEKKAEKKDEKKHEQPK